MNVNGTSTEEDFEIIKFIEDSAPFTMLENLGLKEIKPGRKNKKIF
jgi:hypothetical protein